LLRHNRVSRKAAKTRRKVKDGIQRVVNNHNPREARHGLEQR
jgi:hypothetical protein